MKRSIVLLLSGLITLTAFGQREEDEEKGG